MHSVYFLKAIYAEYAIYMCLCFLLDYEPLNVRKWVLFKSLYYPESLSGDLTHNTYISC